MVASMANKRTEKFVELTQTVKLQKFWNIFKKTKKLNLKIEVKLFGTLMLQKSRSKIRLRLSDSVYGRCLYFAFICLISTFSNNYLGFQVSSISGEVINLS